jgi:DNA adenine methylase
MSIKSLSSPLKWAGGKRKLVPKIKELFNRFECRLVEPFVGGASIAFGLDPTIALLNDTNEKLINFYHQLQLGFTIDQQLLNEKEFYYLCRTEFNSKLSDKKLEAELFYYLNRSCFNGLYRVNNSGGFNVPFGQYKTINYKYDFREYQNKLPAELSEK